MEGAYLQKNTLRRPQGKVGAGNGLRVALKGDTAIVDLGNFISEVINLIFYNALKTEMAGSDQFKSLHHINIHNEFVSNLSRICFGK